jgi:transcription elongation factor Elf1
MAQTTDSTKTVPIVDKTSWYDKHSGRSFVAGVTKEDGEWTTVTYCKNSSQTRPDWTDAPQSWQEEWQARRQQRNAAKSRVKALLDTLDTPLFECPVCSGDSVHSVSNEAVKDAAYGNIPSYESYRDYPVYWCSSCSCNFKSDGDHNYTGRTIYADVFDFDAPSAHVSTHFSMRQDRKKGKLMETADKYQETLQDFHEGLLEVRQYVAANEDVEFDYLD